MKILVINAGSSSLKYQLIDMEDEKVLAKGNCERIGIGGHITHKTFDGKVFEQDAEFPTHSEAFETLKEVLLTGEGKVIDDLSEIDAVGHRVVHGGEKFAESVLITDEMLEVVDSLSELAPLHNPANITAIKACQKALGDNVPQVAVFDTAFHQSMPQKAYTYAIPYEYYEKDGIRRYGFHGTSHRFVSKRCAELIGKPAKDLKIVTCHLGNGSSITAVDGGKSVDTSMGFTPLAGIVMGTRCGDIDVSIIPYLAEKYNLTMSEINDILNKKSGYLGVSGVTSDDRDLRVAAIGGNKRAELAGIMMRYSIKKYIGAYAAAMGGLDAVVFTGGIGENSAEMREEVCSNMSFLGVEIDNSKNVDLSGTEADISADGARVRTFIIPTDEELTIARDTKEVLNK